MCLVYLYTVLNFICQFILCTHHPLGSTPCPPGRRELLGPREIPPPPKNFQPAYCRSLYAPLDVHDLSILMAEVEQAQYGIPTGESLHCSSLQKSRAVIPEKKEGMFLLRIRRMGRRLGGAGVVIRDLVAGWRGFCGIPCCGGHITSLSPLARQEVWGDISLQP